MNRTIYSNDNSFIISEPEEISEEEQAENEQNYFDYQNWKDAHGYL